MMAGNPSWWGINNGMHSQPSQFLCAASNSSLCSATVAPDHHHVHHSNQGFPGIRSWSQLLLGSEEEKYGGSLEKKLEESNWEDQVLNLNPSLIRVPVAAGVKQELVAQSTSQFYDDHHHHHHQFHANNRPNNNNSWPPLISSPNSCTTTSSFSFSGSREPTPLPQGKKHHPSECNSTSSGGVQPKKARVQQSSAKPALKVRKEKLGDRITALHQLVSPFGKTDTASVLSEAIGYIRFLQGQIEALSLPYMRSTAIVHQHHSSLQERHCFLPQEAGQFLNDSMGMDGRGAPNQEGIIMRDLRSRGLCLVPISCTQHVANDNGADFWAPAAFGGGGSGF